VIIFLWTNGIYGVTHTARNPALIDYINSGCSTMVDFICLFGTIGHGRVPRGSHSSFTGQRGTAGMGQRSKGRSHQMLESTGDVRGQGDFDLVARNEIERSP